MRALKLEPWKFLAFPSNLPRPRPRLQIAFPREEDHSAFLFRLAHSYRRWFVKKYCWLVYVRKNIVSVKNLRSFTISHSQTNRLMCAVLCLHYKQHVPGTGKQELPTQVAARYPGSLLPRFEPKGQFGSRKIWQNDTVAFSLLFDN